MYSFNVKVNATLACVGKQEWFITPIIKQAGPVAPPTGIIM